MIDHPYLTSESYTTTMIAWKEGSLVFFESPGADGVALMDTYYLSYVLTMLIAIFTVLRKQHADAPRTGWYERIACVVHVTAGSLLGARIFYALIYNFELFWQNPELWLGGSGMSTHGAILGALFGAWVWAKRFRYPMRRLLDQGAYPLAYGTLLGRIANFLNGELYGRAAPDWLPWAMRFPMKDGQGHDLVVSQSGELYSVIKRGEASWVEPSSVEQGFEAAKELALKQLSIAEGSSTKQFFYEAITDPRHPSQLYQALSDGLLLLVFLLIMARFIKTPGVRAAWALIGYGVSRFFMEFFRQPDPQMGYFLDLFSTGQLLSLGVITGGVLWMRWMMAHPSTPVMDGGAVPPIFSSYVAKSGAGPQESASHDATLSEGQDAGEDSGADGSDSGGEPSGTPSASGPEDA